MTAIHLNDSTDPLQMLTVPEVATLLKVSERHVYREIEVGKLPAHDFSKRLVRILRADLAAYVKAGKNKKGPPG